MDVTLFLQEDHYVDYSEPIIQQHAQSLFHGLDSDKQKAVAAYHFVRDTIPHLFDIKIGPVVSSASQVLRHRVGICHSKACLLAALLRAVGIPTGFCFQHITLLDDDSQGYCVHCYNAIWLDGRWVRVDARGNKPGVHALFSLDAPVLAFPNRPAYDEYFWDGVYARPHAATMKLLGFAVSLQEVMELLPDSIADMGEPDAQY